MYFFPAKGAGKRMPLPSGLGLPFSKDLHVNYKVNFIFEKRR
jgi:hypothetical protein